MEYEQIDQEEAERIQALQDVIQIYSSAEAQAMSGLMRGGLDMGIDLSLD